jgi:hypothetical protein
MPSVPRLVDRRPGASEDSGDISAPAPRRRRAIRRRLLGRSAARPFGCLGPLAYGRSSFGPSAFGRRPGGFKFRDELLVVAVLWGLMEAAGVIYGF